MVLRFFFPLSFSISSAAISSNIMIHPFNGWKKPTEKKLTANKRTMKKTKQNAVCFSVSCQTMENYCVQKQKEEILKKECDFPIDEFSIDSLFFWMWTTKQKHTQKHTSIAENIKVEIFRLWIIVLFVQWMKCRRIFMLLKSEKLVMLFYWIIACICIIW